MRVIKNLVCKTMFDNGSALHNHQTIRQKTCNSEIMRNDNRCNTKIAYKNAEKI